MKEVQKIKSSILKEGMIFSAPVFFDDGENMFLAEKKAVRPYHLNAIKRWKISYLITYGHILTDDEIALMEKRKQENLQQNQSSNTIDELGEVEELDEIEEAEEVDEVKDCEELSELEELDQAEDIEVDTPIGEVNSTLVKQYNLSVTTMGGLFAEYKQNKKVSRTTIESLTEIIINMVSDEKNGAVSFILNSVHTNGLASAAINIAIMSATMAFHRNIQQRKVKMIIVAALLHDLGMLDLPDSILNKKGKLTTEEIDLLKMHSSKTARYLQEEMLFPREICDIVEQHHENWDGSGYPGGRKGQDIDIASRILAITDAFEAMVSQKVYRDSIIGYEAVKNLLSDNGKRFDPMMLKTFIEIMGVYPVGSLVLLNSGSVARVIECEVNAPFLPTVKILISKNGGQCGDIKSAVIKLRTQHKLFIIRAVNPKEIDKIV